MSTIVRFDPVMRHLVSTESGGPELPAILTQHGIDFIVVTTLPGPMEMLAVDTNKNLVPRKTLPEESRLESYTTDDPDATVPEIPSLPDGAVVDPPVGTRLQTRDNYVTVRAPYFLDHRFVVHLWTPADERARLTAWAANRRWELMQIGAVWRGHQVATDDVSQSRMTAAVLSAQILATWQTKWQFLDGSSATVGKEEMLEIALTAQAYVNSLFTTFDTVRERISSGEVTTIEEIEALMPPRGPESEPKEAGVESAE